MFSSCLKHSCQHNLLWMTCPRDVCIYTLVYEIVFFRQKRHAAFSVFRSNPIERVLHLRLVRRTAAKRRHRNLHCKVHSAFPFQKTIHSSFSIHSSCSEHNAYIYSHRHETSRPADPVAAASANCTSLHHSAELPSKYSEL